MIIHSPSSTNTEIRQSESSRSERLVAGSMVFSIMGVGVLEVGVPLESMADFFIIVSEPCSRPGEEENSKADKDGGEPAAAVDIFVQEKPGCQGIGDKGQRGRCRAHHAEVGPRESDEVAKECDGHEEYSA